MRETHKVTHILIVILLSLIIFVGVAVSVYLMADMLYNENSSEVQTSKTVDKDEVTTIQNEEDLQTAKENLTTNGSDNTKEDEAKLNSLTSQ